ncbi:hypothetical protein [Furfurilactobacillus entadae]|uniref:hypothetical protein n=1 Tax=Furfurilactobacillus entadae TaxID=2922307 RepID=UPI0035E52006
MSEVDKSALEESLPEFDYGALPDDLSGRMHERALKIVQIKALTITALGQQLYEAQQDMASVGNGTPLFTNWLKAQGFSKQTGYNLINRFHLVQNLDEVEDKELFEQLPKSLTYEMSKPSASAALNQQVFAGDVTTTKEYKALEQKWKTEHDRVSIAVQERASAEREQERATKALTVYRQDSRELRADKKTLQQDVRRLERQLQTASDQEPEVITQEPADYADLKASKATLTETVSRLQAELTALKAQPVASNQHADQQAKVAALQNQIQNLEMVVNTRKEVNEAMRAGQQLLEKIGGILYLPGLAKLDHDDALVTYSFEFSAEMKRVLAQLDQVLPPKKVIKGAFKEGGKAHAAN